MMKKLLTVLLACTLLLSMAACSPSGSGTADVSELSVSGSQDTLMNQKKENSIKLTEKEAIDLVREQAVKDAKKEDVVVDEKSGQILDQNDTAYIIAFDISDSVYGNYMYMEAYWLNKETQQIKDVCSLNEYYDGMIDITKGESKF